MLHKEKIQILHGDWTTNFWTKKMIKENEKKKAWDLARLECLQKLKEVLNLGKLHSFPEIFHEHMIYKV